MRDAILKALREIEGWAEAKAQAQDAEMRDLQAQYSHFRDLEQRGKAWTGNAISGAIRQPPQGPQAFTLLNQTLNQVGREIGELKRSINAVSLIGNEALKLRRQVEIVQSTNEFARQLAKKGARITEQGARAGGRLLGKGFSAVGRRLSALEEEPMPRRLPVVPYAVVMRGLNMPGEHRNIGVSEAIARKYLTPSEDYFLDERLMELRGVKTRNTIRLNEFEIEWFKQRAR